MKAKDKANELVDKMYNTENCHRKHTLDNRYCDCSDINRFQAMQCAIIAVDEIIIILQDVYYNYNVGGQLDYYIEVKQELEQML